MVSKKKPVEWITERFCDICGEKISDGLHDGGGDVNFWGTYLKVLKAEETNRTIEANHFIGSKGGVIIKIGYGLFAKVVYEICHTCEEELIAHIALKKQQHQERLKKWSKE